VVEHDDFERIFNASDYMVRYRRHAPEAAIAAQIQALDDLPRVDVATLKSVWPQSDFQPRLSTNLQYNTTDAGFQANTTNTLTDSSMRTVIEKGLQGDLPEVEWFAEAEQVPNFTTSLSAYLYSRPKILHGQRVSLILGLALKGCDMIDLSSFELLTFEEILAIIDIRARCGKRFGLTLPDLEDFSTTKLSRLLSSGLVRELHVGSHQIGSLEDCIKAIDGTSVTRFTVPELYSRSFAPLELPTGRNRYRMMRYDEAWVSPLPSLPTPQQFPITQLVFVQWPAHSTAPASIRGDFVPPWSKALISENLDMREKVLLSLPLSDCFLTAAQGIAKLPTFISHLACSLDFESHVVLGMLQRLSLQVSPHFIPHSKKSDDDHENIPVANAAH
jgi:hypothetical protein